MRPAFIIYTAGVGAMFLADLLVGRFLSHVEVADWSQLRSLVGIAAVVPLIGLDQVLVRSPAASEQLLRLLALQVPLVGLAVGIAMQAAGLVSDWWLGAGLAIGSAVSLVQYQYFRSHKHQVLSQLAQQGWKVAALALVAIMVATGWRGDLVLWAVGLMVALNIIMAAAVAVLPPDRLHPQVIQPAGMYYAIGSRFMVTAIMLALSVYAEQLVVNRLGSHDEAALYFTSATYFLFPVSFLNGYLAFLISPWMRDQHQRFITIVRTRWWLIVAAAATYAVALNLLGWSLWILVSPSVGGVDRGLQLLFLWAGFTRTLYLLPSGYLGVFGNPRQHDKLVLLQLISLVPVAALFFALRLQGVDLLLSAAAASALNWSLRTFAGFFMTGAVVRSFVGKVS
jgi:hypothetical protein